MRIRDVRGFAAAALVALLPSTGAAFEWNAQIGFLYDRTDSWQETALPRHSTQPRLDLDLRLELKGDVAGPGVFAWRGTTDYRRTSASIDGANEWKSNALTYHGDVALFQHRNSPFTLTAFADREDTRLDLSQGATVTGDRLTRRWGARASLVGELTPAVDLGYTRIDFDETIASVPRSRGEDLVTASFSEDVGAFSAGATYQGDWSDGTWVIDQFQTQEVNVRGDVRFGPTNELVLVDRFYRRVPTATTGPTFSADANAFTASLWIGRTPGEAIRAQFSSQQTLTGTPGSQEESRANSARYSHDVRLDPELFLRANLDLSTTEQANAAARIRSTGATLWPELWWRREVATGGKIKPGVRAKKLYEISGGPLLSVLATDGAAPAFGYGAATRLQATFPWHRREVGAIYEVRYGKDLFGQPGWLFQQSGSGTVAGDAGPGTYSAVATVLASRSWNPVIGDDMTQSISLLANYAWLRYTAFAQFVLQNGVLPGSDGFKGDGLVIPVGFDTRRTSVNVGGTARFQVLTARLVARYERSVAPGQPDIDGTELTAGLGYRYGAFELSLDDRFTASPGLTRNVVFLRLSRTLGSNY